MQNILKNMTIVLFLVSICIIGLAAPPAEMSQKLPIAAITMLLFDDENLSNKIRISQANNGYALAGAKHTIVFSIEGVDQSNIEARPSSPNPNIKSFFGGGVEYSISSAASPANQELSFNVFNRESGGTSTVSAPIEIIPTKEILSGNVGTDGGQLSNEWQDFVVTIPRDAVTSVSEVKLLAGNLPNGETIYRVTSSTPLQKVVRIRTPRNTDVFAVQNSQSVLTKSNISSSKVVWKSNFANEVSVSSSARAFENLGLTNPTVFLENLVSKSVDSTTINHTAMSVTENVLSSNLISHCGGFSEYLSNCGDIKPPVLLVHGYTPLGLGGGTGTWGNLAAILKEDGYPVFEFSWNTSSTYKRTASELALAIDQMNQQIGKKVHIVAHSFGGVLSRTYLQGFAENSEYKDGVASLVTIGTPHSGIFSSDDLENNSISAPIVSGGSDESRQYPRGQDNSLPLVSSVGFKLCSQFSCHQAGEPTRNSFNPIFGGLPIECELPSSISSTPSVCSPDFSSFTNLATDFGVDDQHGMAIHRIQTENPNNQLPVPALVLMSLIMDRPVTTVCELSINADSFLEGDGLITYSGQRFRYDSGSNTFAKTTIIPETGVSAEERLLGLNVQNSLPNSPVNPSDVFYINNEGNCVEDHFEGYYHASAMATARAFRSESERQRLRSTSLVTGKRDIRLQVNIENDDFDENLNSKHATYEALSGWLKNFPTETYVPDFVTVNARVVNSVDGTGISNAKLVVYSGSTALGETYTDEDGKVAIDLPRSKSDLFFSVVADNFRQYDNIIGFKLPEAPVTLLTLEPINLHPDVLRLGTLTLRPIHAYDKYYLSGVEYRVSRNSRVWTGTTGIEGAIEIPNLVRGNYDVLLKKDGYLRTLKTLSLDPASSEPIDFDIRPVANKNLTSSTQDLGSFTKILSDGTSVESNAANWSCVKDERTGLFWETKTNDGGPHDSSNRYRWGGYTAMNRGLNPQPGEYYSDWNELVVNANEMELCGLNNWRVPNRSELRSIADFQKHEPAVNTEFFPFIDSTGLGSIYWTNEVYPNNLGQAWVLGFDSGFGANVSRSSNSQLPLMLVSGGKNDNL